MLFAGTVDSNGGGGGSELWQFITGTSGDIELLTGEGVTGIDAVNPEDANMSFVFTSLAGSPVAAWVYQDTVDDVIYEMGIDESLAIFPVMFAHNLTTGTTTHSIVTDGQTSQGINTLAGQNTHHNVSDGNIQSKIQSPTGENTSITVTNGNINIGVDSPSGESSGLGISNGNLSAEVSDGAGNYTQVALDNGEAIMQANDSSNQYSEVDVIPNNLQLKSQDGAGNLMSMEVLSTKISFKNTSGTNLFSILPSGHITTNQSLSSLPKTANGIYIPIYDSGDTLLGYIQLTT